MKQFTSVFLKQFDTKSPDQEKQNLVFHVFKITVSQNDCFTLMFVIEEVLNCTKLTTFPKHTQAALD